MSSLSITIGQATDKGVKSLNQDYHGTLSPKEPLLGSKGAALALADGISSSEVSQFASKIAVNGFLEDYFCTPESWTAKTSAYRVIQATNSWLYSQTRNSPYRLNFDKGYVCTFSALIFKSNSLHIFHIGDSRVFQVVGDRLEQLTEDHRLWVSENKSYLSRALGMRQSPEIDYHTQLINRGDIFITATDGVYEFVDQSAIINIINQHTQDLNQAAKMIVNTAIENGSDDNLTIQIAMVMDLPLQQLNEINLQINQLPYPPELRPRMSFDGFEIIRELHHSSRSHLYLVKDELSQDLAVLKVPAVDLRQNEDDLERFLMEDWVARRVDNVHLLKPFKLERKRNYLYTLSEYIEGQTLTQWMRDNPEPSLETVRNMIEQIARGLQALHRLEMLHQDLRPANIMIDQSGTVKIIDFGSVRISGLDENHLLEENHILGTMQYTAPEYFLGEAGTVQSDLFSLGVIAYQMLSGHQPYGTHIARTSSYAEQRKLTYQLIGDTKKTIPVWIDGALRKAVHINPAKRYETLSEFIYDLRYPNKYFSQQQFKPLIERNPLLFWKVLSLILFIIALILLFTHPVIRG